MIHMNFMLLSAQTDEHLHLQVTENRKFHRFHSTKVVSSFSEVLVEQLPLKSAAGLPLLSQLPLEVAVLRLLPGRLLLSLVQLTLQGAEPLGHLQNQTQRSAQYWHSFLKSKSLVGNRFIG
ncbi:hypothetical protein ATANTOWER_011141 [Ataeniobius toweri]|uniref:Uncharacterized protein n=1 Tax=Ataeniobius toweri TaxID=208326 RepID=A0ABU7CJ18_9TELE|nr:hypothetical protein [Ataeniobius toweri]